MSILNKDTIIAHILPFVPVAKRGKKLTQNQQIGIVEAILHRLKTGCQWRELPMKEFFNQPYSAKTVFHHFNAWSKAGLWQKIWLALLQRERKSLDLSSVQLDGTQTRCHRARQKVGYQTRKADQSSNLLFLSDNQGLLLALSEPISGQHHDLFEIETHFEQLLDLLTEAGIATEGLFLNADAGFDSENLRRLCFKKTLSLTSPLTQLMVVCGTEKSISTSNFTKDARLSNAPLPNTMDSRLC